MDYRRANGYMFWLTEYKNRRFINNVGENSAFLIRLFSSAFSTEFHDRYATTDMNDIIARYMSDFSTYILEGKWNKALDCEEIKKKYGDDIRNRIAPMQHEIENLSNFIATNMVDFQFFYSTAGRVLDPEFIVALCINNRIHKFGRINSQCESFVYRHNDIEYDDFVYRNSAFTVFDSNGSKISPYSSIPVINGKMSLANVVIDLRANLKDILTDVVSFVCAGREEAACADLPERSDEAVNSLLENGCPGYGPCSGGHCEDLPEISVADAVLREGMRMDDRTYQEKSNNPRTIGLWLYEYVKEKGGSVSAAIREAKKLGLLAPLGYDISDENVLRRAYNMTFACIREGKVLTIKDS